MTEITVTPFIVNFPNNSLLTFTDAFTVKGYPGPIGEAEIYAIKTALEKQVKLNAEVQRLKDRRKVAITAAH